MPFRRCILMSKNMLLLLFLAAPMVLGHNRDCGADLQLQEDEIVELANYWYTSNENCSWYVESPSGTQIQFDCSDLVMEVGERCSEDFLLISISGDKTLADGNIHCQPGRYMETSIENKMFIKLFVIAGSVGATLDCRVRVIGKAKRDPPNNLNMIVALFKRYEHQHLCGALLITKINVAIKADCIYKEDLKKLRILAGAYYKGKEPSAIDYTETYKIKSKVIHPQFDPVTKAYNIAVLKLARPVEVNRDAEPLCIPYVTPKQIVSNRNRLIVAGWLLLSTPVLDKYPRLFKKPYTFTVKLRRRETCRTPKGARINDKDLCCAYVPTPESCQNPKGDPVFAVGPGSRVRGLGFINEGTCEDENFSITELYTHLAFLTKYSEGTLCVDHPF